MSVIRTNKNKNYTTIHNGFLQDLNLKPDTRAILALILTLPDDWIVYSADIQKRAGIGKHTMTRIWGELEGFGYLYRTRTSVGKKGILWVKEVYEHPSMNPHYDGKPPHTPYLSIPDFSKVENPDIESSGNILSTNLELSTKSTKKDSSADFSSKNTAVAKNATPAKIPKTKTTKPVSENPQNIVKNPHDYMVKDIKKLDLSLEQWKDLLENEQKIGKLGFRPGVIKHANAKINANHPALQAYREIVERYPVNGWGEKIMNTVGVEQPDVLFWKDVVLNWVGVGYNPMNVKGMLEFYQKRELPGDNHNGNGHHEAEQSEKDEQGRKIYTRPDGTKYILAADESYDPYK